MALLLSYGRQIFIQKYDIKTMKEDNSVFTDLDETQFPWYWKRYSFFSGVTQDVERCLRSQAEKISFKRGEMVMRSDDPGDRIFFLEKGLIRIFNLAAQGEITTFWFCVPDDVFGAGAVAGVETQHVFGQAIEPSTVHALSRVRYEQLLLEHPRLALNALRQTGARLRLACDALADRGTHDTEARLAKSLLHLGLMLGRSQNGEIHLRVCLPNHELAHLIGASRQTVNRILNHFTQIGWIRIETRRLILTSPSALWSFLQNKGYCI